MTSVGIVLFPMDNESLGGIRNIIYHFVRGFEQIGVETEVYLTKHKVVKNKISNKWIKLIRKEPVIISWNNPLDLKTLDVHDFLLTFHIGPHGTRKNPPKPGWENIFINTEPEKYPVICDPYWKKYYPHGVRVRKYISGLIVQHEAALRSIISFPALKALIYLPYDSRLFEDIKWENKERILVSFTHWKKWKNHKYLLQTLSKYGEDIKQLFDKILLYSDGIERRKMSSPHKNIREKFGYGDIWFEAQPYFEYKGYAPEDEKIEVLRRALFSIDLSWSESWNGNMTYTCFEAYTYGAILIGSSEHYIFDREAYIDCGYPRSIENIYRALLKTKEIDEERWRYMIKRGREFIKNKHDAKEIARQVLYFMEHKDTDGSFKIAHERNLFSIKK